MRKKVACLYTRYYLECIQAYMVKESLTMYIDESGKLWHIEDFNQKIAS